MGLQAPARAVVTWPTMEPRGFRSPHTLSRVAVALLALVLVLDLANLAASLLIAPSAVLAILVVRRQTAYQIARARGGAISEVFR